MNWLIAIWNWLDGKKTNIGAFMVAAAVVILKLAGIWNLHWTFLQPLLDTLNYLGTLLVGIGLGAKATKAAIAAVNPQ